VWYDGDGDSVESRQECEAGIFTIMLWGLATPEAHQGRPMIRPTRHVTTPSLPLYYKLTTDSFRPPAHAMYGSSCIPITFRMIDASSTCTVQNLRRQPTRIAVLTVTNHLYV
jgi:hypothetical protein